MSNLCASDRAAEVELTVPQFGEGIHEVRILTLCKEPGAPVAQDEIVYELETVKSAFSIESEFRGQLAEWFVKVGDMVAVGAPVARILVDVAPNPAPAPAGAADPSRDEAPARARPDAPRERVPTPFFIPPRTRAYAREKAIAEADLRRIVPEGRKVMPSDVDRFIQGRTSKAAAAPKTLSAPQRRQNQRAAGAHEVQQLARHSREIANMPMRRVRTGCSRHRKNAEFSRCWRNFHSARHGRN